MLVELAIGDAYGAGFEYAAESFVTLHNAGARYVPHPRHTLEPGQYTDDTQMSIAVAEALLSDEPFSRELLARHFVGAFKRDPRPGYARGFQQLLESVADGEDLLARLVPRSDKSGAAMRAVPIGILPDTAEVKEKAALQARITHDTRDGVDAAVAVALASHFCVYALGSLDELGQFVASHLGDHWAAPYGGPVGPKGWMSARAAITAVARATSLRALLQDCVAFTGDVDTVAAIALGCAASSPAVERDLPQALVDGLESGPYGRGFLGALDRRLFSLAER